MKKSFKNGTLSILSVLAIGIYIALILSSLISGVDDFKLGFEEGMRQGKNNTENIEQREHAKMVYFLDLKAKSGFSAFPDSIENLNGNEKVAIRFDKAQISTEDISVNGNSKISVYKFLQFPIGFLILAIVVLIPFFFIKLNVSLRKEVVFDKKNIKNMRVIGVLLMLYYFVSLAGNWVIFKINTSMFEFSDYTIQFQQAELIWILLGVVVLLFAEVLSRGTKLKEEQDLTI